MNVVVFCFLVCLSYALSDNSIDINNSIVELFERVKVLEDKNEMLVKDCLKKDKEIADLNRRITVFEMQDAMQAGHGMPHTGDVKAKFSTAMTGKRHRRQSVENEVAFFATVTPHDVEHLGQKQNIVFDNAVTNIGNGYHPLHGIFTAPVEGTYVFAVTVSRISPNGTYYCYLDVNGETVSNFITHRYEQSSHLAVVHLKTGSDVSVKNFRSDEHILGHKYTAFSGFLPYQTYENEPSVDIVG